MGGIRPPKSALIEAPHGPEAFVHSAGAFEAPDTRTAPTMTEMCQRISAIARATFRIPEEIRRCA